MTILETARGLEGEALGKWLESLSPEELLELWLQGVEATLRVIDKLAEVCDGD